MIEICYLLINIVYEYLIMIKITCYIIDYYQYIDNRYLQTL